MIAQKSYPELRTSPAAVLCMSEYISAGYWILVAVCNNKVMSLGVGVFKGVGCVGCVG